MGNTVSTAAVKVRPSATPAQTAKQAAFRTKLAEALAGTAYPAATDHVAWSGLLASIPAVAEAIAASRNGKYKDKGLVGNAGLMVQLTPAGLTAAASGSTKEGGKVTVHGATCRAARLASEATGGGAVCKAAVVFFMVANADVLALLHQTKATDGNGKATVTYIGRTTVPCPAWAAGYVQGNVRVGRLRAAA
jgi:hypothetical protein